MTKNQKIKVIKKGETAAAVQQPNSAKEEKRHAAREMVSNVTNWVADFQARKRDETKAAFEKFLVPKTRPSEL